MKNKELLRWLIQFDREDTIIARKDPVPDGKIYLTAIKDGEELDTFYITDET